MNSTKNEEDVDYKGNKLLIQRMCSRDGHLESPIDLSLDTTVAIGLEPLRWIHPDDAPVKMKMTNSGDTVVISGKWNKERPYLTGGPLDGNYVFSQLHFHWGSSEHEGSEHTIKGLCYPLEMHAVFFKTRYLTQAAALKQDDGIVIVAYLFKLQSRSCTGLQWLASQLPQVTEPKTSAEVTSVPLSSIMVPFSADYLTYWGALVSSTCQHPVMWLVSRAALGITSDNLKMFRTLLNTKKESIKNFRNTNPSMSRTVFHVNPSSESKQLLYKGAVDPPCQMVIVNHVQTTPLDENEAKKIYSKGDSSELNSDNKLSDKDRIKLREQRMKAKSSNRRLGRSPHETKALRANSELKNSSKTSTVVSENSSGERSPSRLNKKLLNQTKLPKQCVPDKKLQEEKENNEINSADTPQQTGDCLHVNLSSTMMTESGESESINSVVTTKINNIKCEKETKKEIEKKIVKEKPPAKSKLPKLICKNKTINTNLQSSYAAYFKRPESAPIKTSMKSPSSIVKPTTPTLVQQNSSMISNKLTSTIPRPSVKNIKADTQSGTVNSPSKNPGTASRPTSTNSSAKPPPKKHILSR